MTSILKVVSCWNSNSMSSCHHLVPGLEPSHCLHLARLGCSSIPCWASKLNLLGLVMNFLVRLAYSKIFYEIDRLINRYFLMRDVGNQSQHLLESTAKVVKLNLLWQINRIHSSASTRANSLSYAIRLLLSLSAARWNLIIWANMWRLSYWLTRILHSHISFFLQILIRFASQLSLSRCSLPC